MAFTTQTNFAAVLDGTDINELNKKIDYSKNTLEERKEVVEGILNGTEFYNEYFSEHFKGSINTTDHLSSEINVCKSLERMANYLLNSDEIKAEEDAEKVKYIFHTDEKYFQSKLDRERSVESLTKVSEEYSAENIIHFLKKADPSYKDSKTQTINSNDLNREGFVGEVLQSYYSFYEYLSEELKNKDTKHNRYLLTKAKGSVLQDMIYSKDHLLGVWGYDLKNFLESTESNLDVFDFTNEEHLRGKKITFVNNNGVETTIEAKGLLFFKNDFEPTNDMSYILLDLDNTIKKAGLTKEENFVLYGVRNGLSQEEIAEQLNTYQKRISRLIDSIVKKVVSVGDKYDAVA